MNESTVRTGGYNLWWMGIVVGIVTILFGIAALFWPGLTLATLVTLFSVYVLIWGLAEIIRSLVHIDGFVGSWWLSLIFGVLVLGVGVYLVRHPQVSFKTLILLIGFTLIFRGIFDIVIGFLERRTASAKVLSVIAGLVALVAGIIVLRQPVAGGVAFVWVLGLYALIMGPLTIAATVEVHDFEVNTLGSRARTT